ncbi:dysbindin protein homolog [Dermacentor albipictus]|uniref:dysbindin protein homolog n=1 Tax=Dermacentor albipictus TaxID=60249 RepID=UPI0038FD1AFD
MLENLRDKLHSVQQDFSFSLRNLSLGDTSLPKSQQECEKRLLGAGADLLHYYQSKWEELHSQNEGNAKRAEEVDVLIAGLQSYCHQQLVSMQQLNLQLTQLPKLQQGVQDLMNTIGELEGMFEEVELRLVSLEDVIETQALQEKQLDERFKLALYGEKKKGHFESLKDKLEEDHQTLLRQLEEQEQEVLRERQETFGEVFRRDLEAYKEQGTLHRIEAVHDAQVDLEDIDLEGNDEEREALDEFLADVISTTDGSVAVEDSIEEIAAQ